MKAENFYRHHEATAHANTRRALLSTVALVCLFVGAGCSAGGAKSEGQSAASGNAAGQSAGNQSAGNQKAASEIAEGGAAPDFTLPGDDGRMVKLSDYRGKQPVVLYFYPKDETAGCTKEACAFRDNLSDFKKAGVEVLGVSVDSIESHQKFKQKENLNFTLLSDEKKEVTNRYGVLASSGVARRVTFIIDKNGTVRKIYRDVSPEEHAAEVLEFARSLA